MIPPPSEVVRIRFWTAAFVRVCSLFLLVLATLPLLSWLIEGFMDDDLPDLRYYGDRIIFGLVMMVMAVTGLLLAERFSRMIVRLPPPHPCCPRCGYAIVRLTSGGRCSECGLELDAAFAPDAQTRTENVPSSALTESEPRRT